MIVFTNWSWIDGFSDERPMPLLSVSSRGCFGHFRILCSVTLCNSMQFWAIASNSMCECLHCAIELRFNAIRLLWWPFQISFQCNPVVCAFACEPCVQMWVKYSPISFQCNCVQLCVKLFAILCAAVGQSTLPFCFGHFRIHCKAFRFRHWTLPFTR